MSKIIGQSLPNIPWEEKPEGYRMPLWRYSGNPIIGRDGNRVSNSVFNSAIVPFEDGFAGVFRCDSRSISMDIFVGRSKDGIHWEIEDTPVQFTGADGEILKREYRYDPRVCFLEDRYYITWCNGYHGPTIGVAYTFDFKKFVQLENAFLPCNRNGVLFPRKIQGLSTMLSRASDNGHTPFGDIFISQSPDMEFWGRSSSCDEPDQGGLLGMADNKGRPTDTDRDGRGLADDLSWCSYNLQRICISHGGGAFGSGAAVEGALPL